MIWFGPSLTSHWHYGTVIRPERLLFPFSVIIYIAVPPAAPKYNTRSAKTHHASGLDSRSTPLPLPQPDILFIELR
jgi:hypothetical protein